MTNAFEGNLFSSDFLTESITRVPDWSATSDDDLRALETSLTKIFEAFPTDKKPNESQTEDDLIWKVLNALGWTSHLRQQGLSPKGREDVPDGLLFKDDAAKAQANTFKEEWRRYEFGLATVESKRWQRPLDRQSGQKGEETAPSTQMLRYLRRIDDLTTGKLRWGILTNGAQWRLYYQGARSVAEQFFQVDLGVILGVKGHDGGLFALKPNERKHWLKVFTLIFRREAFLPTTSDTRTFHQRAIDEGRFYEERVATNLSELVFGQVFPELAKAIAAAAPDANLDDVRNAALVLLYRLLFILYAEDRDLLPVNDDRYDDYSFRDKVRLDVGRRKDNNDTFSSTAQRYWAVIKDLCRAIDKGDASIGLPPYNGGLFDSKRTPLLNEIGLNDETMAGVVDKLSFERADGLRRYINYRNLSVQQLGSIYERLLEHELTRVDDELTVRPNIFARKGSGSYYTPEDLVQLIIREAVDPLVQEHVEAFRAKADELATSAQSEEDRLITLKGMDPAERLLELKICDPAMGSGHFLVNLVDYLANQVITAMAEAEAIVTWARYVSPLTFRVDAIRTQIRRNADQKKWTINASQLDDRHIVHRMVLKRCIYGVDKNPMAVELAKVALWLHTFTVGAPLSFLDHHLRCGDSLFGSWVKPGINKASRWSKPLLLHEPLQRALRAASKMQIIEGLTDAEIAEAHRSADVFTEVQLMTSELDALLSLIHALDWLNIRDEVDRIAVQSFFDGVFGDPIKIALGKADVTNGRKEAKRFAEILAQVRELTSEERFLNWQVAYPGVWSDWENDALTGGFDAVIGNPPWDRMKLQQVEWFAARRREIALAQRAADRQRMITALQAANDPLAADFAKAEARADAGLRMARQGGDYPLLSGGDTNLYSLFVERAMKLVKPSGMVGLLTPSGIVSDKTASTFFKGVSTAGHLKALYDFENGRQSVDQPPYFPDVHRSFKFCTFIASPIRTFDETKCSFYLHDIKTLLDDERCFTLAAADFARVNPNTGTAPIFKTRRDAKLTTAIYRNASVLVDRSSGTEVKAWPVRYMRMFDMTNDSGLFRTRQELNEREGAYPIGGNHFKSRSGEWLPLYVGRMIHQFDHRAASVVVNEENVHNAAFSGEVTLAQKQDPAYAPEPQYWVAEREVDFPSGFEWLVAFRDIARATDVRTVIASIVPKAGFGNKLPLLLPTDSAAYKSVGPLMLANLNALPLDFVARSKIHSTSVNWYLAEQLPVIPLDRYMSTRFGKKTAASVASEAVLELTYTSDDMASFARDMGYVDKKGNAKAPFRWDDDHRLGLRAKLDAIFFHLYGITDRDDVRYIYSTFPIVEREETEKYGRYRSCELCLAWISALAAGDPDAKIKL